MNLKNIYIKRLSQVSGIKSLSKLSYYSLNTVIYNVTKQLVRHIIIYKNNGNRKVVNISDVEHSLRDIKCMKMFMVYDKIKKCGHYMKKSKNNSKNKQMEYLQKQYECLHIPMLYFSNIIRNIAKEYENKTKFSKESILLLQIAIEDFIIRLFSDIKRLGNISGRKVVYPKDVHFIENVLRLPMNPNPDFYH